VDRGGGERADECGEEDADDARVDAAQGGAQGELGAEGGPEREDCEHQEQAGKEDAEERGEAVERGVMSGHPDGGAEIGCEGEEGSGHCLGCSIAGDEGGLGEPVWRNDGGFEERKDDVAATEDKGPAAIESGGNWEERCGVRVRGELGGDEEQREESACDQAGGAGDGRGWGVGRRVSLRRTADEKPCEEAGCDGDEGGEVCGEEEGDCSSGESDDNALDVGCERAPHREDGLSDDGDGDQLEAVEGAEGNGSGEEAMAEGEREHEESGGEGEAEEGGEATAKSSAKEAEGKAGLAAGGARDGLSECDDLGVGFFTAPGAFVNELPLKVAEMSDGSPEAGAAEAQEDEEDLTRGSCAALCGHGGRVPHAGERSMSGKLPGLGAGGAFEGAGDVGGDPAAVEVSGLGDNSLTVNGALVDAAGVERDVVAEVGVGRSGLSVAPGGVDADCGGVVGEVEEGIEGEVDGPVVGEAFELAQAGGAGGGLEEVHGDVGVREVVDGRVTGFEDAECARGFGDEDAAVNDADVMVRKLEAWRARVVPYGLSW